MMRIRTKLVLSLLIITLLPVFPVYFLVKHLLRTSREIGFNKNVELALEHAVDISREQYATYKTATLALAEKIASSKALRASMAERETRAPAMIADLELNGKIKVDLFDKTATLLNSKSNDPELSSHVFYQNTLMPLTKKQQPDLLNGSQDPGFISAFAPILINGAPQGFVIVTKVVDARFIQGRKKIVDVNQMFKTLEFFDLTEGFVQSFFAVYVPIAMLSVALGYYFSRKITEPLLTLVEGTQRVAEGDWNHRVGVTAKDEIGELVIAFNNMVGALQVKQNQVVALEKMAAWREIARILAHEIKNPLTPIQLTVQQMKDKYPGGDPEYQALLHECSEIVTDEIESLRTLVREFSEFARMPKLNVALGNVNELVEEVGKLYKDRPVDIVLDRKISEFNFDYEKLRRVLINLIENGLDSMEKKPDGTLRVQTSHASGIAILHVSDMGSGIPKDVRDKIFEPYFSTKKSGVGLGLAIVKRIVQEHGGKILLQSEEGKGTTFIIELPLG
ncbi:MAG: ATP-binding protein [bacterium]